MLRARTTQRAERTNRNVKSKVTSQISLNELLIRLLSLHTETSNHDFDDTDKDVLWIANQNIQNPVLNVLQDKITPYSNFSLKYLSKFVF